MNPKKLNKAKKMVREVGSRWTLKPATHLEVNVLKLMVWYADQEQAEERELLKEMRDRMLHWMHIKGVYTASDKARIEKIDKILAE